MEKYVTVSAKIPISLRKRMRRLKIRPSTVFKKALEEELKSEQAAGIRQKSKRLKALLEKIPLNEIVAGIREDRAGR